MDHFHDLKQHHNNPKPMFDVIEPSTVRAQFGAKNDASFPSYIYQSKNHQNKFASQTGQSRTEDSDQISIFDAAKYFSGLHDDQKEQPPSKGGLNHLSLVVPPRLSSVSSSVDDTGSNYGGRSSTCTSNTYRARSFHATPTASSEASWNSQTGLLTNPPGYTGVHITKALSPNSSNSNSNSSTTTPRWPRISAKWLIPRRKCPCSGKKSVQVEEGIESTTPRMVDLRRCTSSNGSATKNNYISPSWFSPRQNSSKIIGTSIPLTSPSTNVVTPPEPRNNNPNFNNLSAKIPNVSNQHHQNPKVVGPLKSFANHSEIISPNAPTAAATTTAPATATIGGTIATTSSTTNGFTFPILENSPLGVKKMFTVIADPPRDSLEVFQPRSHPSPKSRRTSYEDDNVLSDGSSDLFEIDSFSTSYPCRDSIDEMVIVPASSLNASTMKKLGVVCSRSNSNRGNVGENDHYKMDDDEPMTPSVAPTECYAPSEASIDWSVTTAEGFDRASLTNFSVSASEIGMYAAMRRESERNNGGGGGGKGEEKRSSRQKGNGNGSSGNGGGGLLSCRCEKAVSVGPGPIKCSAEGAHRSRRGM